MPEEVKPQETTETTTPSEKVENSEVTESQDKPDTQPVSEPETEDKPETPKEVEEPSEPEVKEPVVSVLDELIGKAGTRQAAPTEQEPAQRGGTTEVEVEIARAVYPKLDPNSSQYDKKFEEEVLKEYLFRNAMSAGNKAPSLREVASQITAEQEGAKEPIADEKKAEATAQPSTITGPEAERTISSDDEKRLVEGVKFGNHESIKELLRLRRSKAE